MELEPSLKQILDISLDPVVQISTSGEVIYWNPKAEEIFGWRSIEIIGKNIFSFLVPENFKEDYLERLNALSKKEMPFPKKQLAEVCALRKSGDSIPIELTMTVTSKNEFTYITAFIKDISQEMKNKISLEQHKRFLNNIINTTPACIKTVSSEGILISMNKAGLEMIEVRSEKMAIGNSVYQLIAPEYKEEFKKFNKKICEGQKSSMEFEIIGIKGGRRWVESFAVPFQLEDESIGQLAVTHDITERKESEVLLDSQKNKLLNSTKMAALGEMASGIAHEINNPLTVILGNATTIKTLNKTKIIDKDMLNKKVEKIEVTVQRISKIISGLKAISRNAESDPMDLVSIKDVVNDSMILCQEKFKRENNELILDFDQSDIFILGRTAQISQVLINLLNNSIDALTGKEDAWTKIIVERNSGNVNISVLDSGPGIEPDVLEKLMQPFFTTKPVGKGTGLGLSISKGVIEDHKGSFSYDIDCPNTCFTITLPLAS